MTPDQYRREGADAMREAAVRIVENGYRCRSCGQVFLGDNGHSYCSQGDPDWDTATDADKAAAIRAIPVAEVLAGLLTRCAECDDEGLLPCPFCGGPAEVVEIDEGENAGGSCVCCTTCGASGNVEFGFKENFVSNWNRRVRTLAPDAVARLVEAAVAEYSLEPPMQTHEERLGRRSAIRGMMVRLDLYKQFTETLAAMEAKHDRT